VANRREALSLIMIAGLTLLTAGAGFYLGFVAPRPVTHGRPIPVGPETGPILYEMRSVVSEPNRVRLEWRNVPGASRYQIKVMSADDESLFVSPDLHLNAWTIPGDLSSRLESQTVYHWLLTVGFPNAAPQYSDTAAFATQ
jgi:hypothetical protein